MMSHSRQSRAADLDEIDQVVKFAIAFMAWLMATTPPKGCLVGLTYGQYACRLQKACRKLGLPRYTPHRPRAEWATHRVLLGRDFVSIREEGRWTVDASLRVYLDVLSSASQQNAPALGQFLERATCIKQNMEAFFPLGETALRRSRLVHEWGLQGGGNEADFYGTGSLLTATRPASFCKGGRPFSGEFALGTTAKHGQASSLQSLRSSA
jgi:hypothetical protein